MWLGTLVFGCAGSGPAPEIPPSADPAPVEMPAATADSGGQEASQDPSASGLDQALEDAAAGVEDAALATLLREHWAWVLETRPTWATQLGVHEFDDRLPDRSLEGLQQRREARREFLKQAQAIDASKLNRADQITLRLLKRRLRSGVEREVCQFELWTVNPRGNPVTTWNFLPELHEVETQADGQALLARYRKIASRIEDEIDRLRKGAEQGLYANAESTRRVIEMVDKQLAQPLEKWPMMAPARAEYAGWDAQAQASFGEALAEVVEADIQPALARYGEFLRDEILPQARGQDETGLAALPEGEACYRALVHDYTTLEISPEKVHEIGLAQIRRIDREMAALGRKALGTRSLSKTLARLRNDPELYFETAEEVEAAAREALADAQAKTPEFFGILPKADCVVRRVPEYEAPYTTIAYYRQPNPDGSKPGEYYVNVYQPETRPRYQARVLAFHESVPGHHLQIAIAQELPEVPAFRRHGGNTVFVEGWALYTERLSGEMGLYETDLDRLGMLSFDAWRAGRLVVDTGIHAKGWSRERAEAFLRKHTALAVNNIENEVDRYIVWPGQALAYKIGQLEIRKLRAEAKRQLGDQFDIKAFHDVVLGAGAISLPILQQRVEAWLNRAD